MGSVDRERRIRALEEAFEAVPSPSLETVRRRLEALERSVAALTAGTVEEQVPEPRTDRERLIIEYLVGEHGLEEAAAWRAWLGIKAILS